MWFSVLGPWSLVLGPGSWVVGLLICFMPVTDSLLQLPERPGKECKYGYDLKSSCDH